MRIMAIDYGDARTGIAISDPTGLLAGYTTVIQSRKAEFVSAEIARLAREQGAEELVMGFPRNMDGSEGARAELYRDFALQVEEAVGMPVTLWDERRTTVEAHAILHTAGKKMKDHKKNVDAVAATLILEGYLTRKKLERQGSARDGGSLPQSASLTAPSSEGAKEKEPPPSGGAKGKEPPSEEGGGAAQP